MNIYTAICIFVFLFSCASTPSLEKEEFANLHMQLAVESIKNENYPEALKELFKAEEYSPNNPYVHANLGYVYFMREKYELSEKHYLRAISIMPTFSEAKNTLARIYIELDDYKKALELLIQVQADLTYPNYPKTSAHLGLLEFKQKNYSQALVHFKKSLEKDRDNCATQVFLGRTYLELKELDSSITTLDKAIFFCEQSGSDEAHYYSAIALYRSGQKDRAKFKFEELIRIFPQGKNLEKAQKMLALIKKGGL